MTRQSLWGHFRLEVETVFKFVGKVEDLFSVYIPGKRYSEIQYQVFSTS